MSLATDSIIRFILCISFIEGKMGICPDNEWIMLVLKLISTW